ncbi:MAG: hypothetical protein KH138_11080 [Firmicutes bacterium]|nr:hypothetical protein [Bacillota bacterium]
MFEKKRGKRFLASVMALIMLLSLVPVGALEADATKDTFDATAYTDQLTATDKNGSSSNDEELKGTVNEDVDPTPTPDGSGENTGDNWKKTSNRILVAVYDGEQGTWPNEPTISSAGYAFMKLSGDTVAYDGAVADNIFWDNNNQYINTDVFFSDLESEKKDTGGNWFAYVGGYAENTGITDDASFWSTGAYSAFDSFKTQIIQRYLDNKGRNDNADNYDLLIYTVKYEEYYQPNQSREGHTLYNAGATGFHIGCAVIPKNAKKVIYEANLPAGCNFVDGVAMPDQVSTTEGSITVAGLTGNVTENQVSGQGKTYTFQGWSENENTNTESYKVGNSLNLTKEVTTLYAIWKDTTPTDSTHDPSTLVPAKFFINLDGEDASNLVIKRVPGNLLVPL